MLAVALTRLAGTTPVEVFGAVVQRAALPLYLAPRGRYPPPAMRTISLSAFSLDLFTGELGHALTRSRDEALWSALEQHALVDAERVALAANAERLKRFHAARANEATLWSRAIYPLLMLAERDDILAWAQAPLVTRWPPGDFELRGVADGALARDEAGLPAEPYLLVIEAKRGVDAQDPMAQCVGSMLAVALTRLAGTTPVEVFGAFTIADTWTFVRAALATDPQDAARLRLDLNTSREYEGRFESTLILAILKGVVQRVA